VFVNFVIYIYSYKTKYIKLSVLHEFLTIDFGFFALSF
jgi:hypothetical protein